jgi:hypothetical protein
VAIDRVQIAALSISILLLLIVLELVRRRRLVEEYSFLWIGSALVLVALSASRHSLDVAARWLGIFYPPIILVMMLIVIVFAASLCFSVIVSRQKQQIERLIEDTAVLSAELRDLKAQQDDDPKWPVLAHEDSGPAPKRPTA